MGVPELLDNRTPEGVWSRVEAALTRHLPKVVPSLRLGATKDNLDRLEAKIELRVPDEVRAYWQIHDGQVDPHSTTTLIGTQVLLSTEGIAEVWEIRTDVWRSVCDDVKDWWWPVLIPITDANGDGFCVHSESGAVYYHYHDDTLSEVLYPSVGRWFLAIAETLESGRFTIEHGAIWPIPPLDRLDLREEP